MKAREMSSNHVFLGVTESLEEGSIGKGEMTFAICHGNEFGAGFDRFSEQTDFLFRFFMDHGVRLSGAFCSLLFHSGSFDNAMLIKNGRTRTEEGSRLT